jgi:hypothetical protein
MMNDSNFSWVSTTTVAYGCLPFDRQWPELPPPWYPTPEPNPFLPNPYEPNPFIPNPYDPNPFIIPNPYDPFNPGPNPYAIPQVIPIGPYTWPPRTPEQRISELELRCAVLERRLADLEVRPEVVQPHEPAQLPCTCDDLPVNALHLEGCPAARDHRSHSDGLEFLRAWIDGHFGKLELDSPTLFKIKQMIDAIGTKMRRRKAPSIDEY